jgi:hypothetical protein
MRPAVEALESIVSLSASPEPLHALVAHHRGMRLVGQITGTWSTVLRVPDIGGEQSLSGSGAVRPLGDVQATGTLGTPGFIRQGRATAVLHLSNARGSIEIDLTGPIQPGFSPPPSSFTYKIQDGTGAYRRVSGHGTATLVETQQQTPICPPGVPCPMYVIAPSFTLTFR